MGSVWLCRDETLGREVAVKQVGLFFDESATDTARALREARNTAALNHPHVVSVFNVAEKDGDVWLIMEHVASHTLSEVISADGRLEPERATHIGAQVAEGLAAAHAVGTIHRDVKPSNILVTTDDHAKIGDFGIARGRDDPQVTQTGLLTGTPAYFSPELARGDAPGPESDVWALGATLYTAVEGRPPYAAGDNALAVLQVIANEPPRRAEHAGVLTEPITRMMDPDPSTRWAMADAAQVLRKIASRRVEWETGTAALPSSRERRQSPAPPPVVSPATEPNTTPPKPARWSGKSLLAAAVAALVLLGSAAAGIALLGGDGGRPESAQPSDGPANGLAEPSPSEPDESSALPNDDDEPSASASAKPTQQESSEPPPAPEPAGSRTGFVDDYFDTVPTDLDAGWQLLSPRMQAEVGRSSFDSFWDQMAQVDASSVSARGGAVDATVVYTYESGRVVRQDNQYQLVRTEGGYLIDEEEVISSRTISE